MMSLAANKTASPQCRALTILKIAELKSWLTAQAKHSKDASRKAHILFGLQQIKMFEDDPDELDLPRPIEPPDGPPIGVFDCIEEWILN